MSSPILIPTTDPIKVPDLLSIDSIVDSQCFRTEIYTERESEGIEPLLLLFNKLFSVYKNELLIYNGEWGVFCLSTFELSTGREQSTANIYPLCQQYLNMCRDSCIDLSYSGFCTCANWDAFLRVILSCVIHHEAPYSPIFCDVNWSFAFYFHHTSSIGILFNGINERVDQILKHAKEQKYSLRVNNINGQ